MSDRKSNHSSSTASQYEEQPKNITKKVLIILAVLLVGSIFLLTLSIRFVGHVARTLPQPEELTHIQPSLVTRVYAKDSTLLHEFSMERRIWKPLDSISPHMLQAVIAIEDRRFYSHWGIDLKRIMSAVIGNVVSFGYSQGASTLTQQLARNLYFTHEKTITRKVREILTAVELEKNYTKDEILELYLNMIYLGGGSYGVEAASQRYFNKSSSDLTLNESAILAGVVQRPEAFRPDKKKNQERSTKRRNTVLYSMRAAGFIDKATYRAEIEKPFTICTNTYTNENAPYFVEYLRQYLENRYGTNKLYNGGLKIYTTLDGQAQKEAEEAMKIHLDTLQRVPNSLFLGTNKVWKKIGVSRDTMLAHFDSLYEANQELFTELPDSLQLRYLEASAIAIDNATGGIRIMIGGRDFAKSKFNRSVQAVRQPGSAIKPFVYGAAIEQGTIHPSSIIVDQPISIMTPQGLWTPDNYTEEYEGPVTIRRAIKLSINTVAIQVLTAISPEKVVTFARKLGLKHDLPAVPALSIGVGEVTNLELTRAYATFANGGNLVKPYAITHVVDQHGRVLEKHSPSKMKALDAGVASSMVSLMQDVVNHGTAIDVRRMGFTRPAGGKTGTTNRYSDAWFVGFTPQITCGVWVGIDERRSMGYGLTGGRTSVPIWVGAMKPLHRNLPVRSFELAGVTRKALCRTSNQLASPLCTDTLSDIFTETNTPAECPIHGSGKMRDSSNVIDFFGSSASSRPNEPTGTIQDKDSASFKKRRDSQHEERTTF